MPIQDPLSSRMFFSGLGRITARLALRKSVVRCIAESWRPQGVTKNDVPRPSVAPLAGFASIPSDKSNVKNGVMALRKPNGSWIRKSLSGSETCGSMGNDNSGPRRSPCSSQKNEPGCLATIRWPVTVAKNCSGNTRSATARKAPMIARIWSRSPSCTRRQILGR